MRICQHANISWRMLFSCGSLPQPGVLDPAANYLHPIQFSLQQFSLGRHTSRLDLDPRPTYTHRNPRTDKDQSNLLRTVTINICVRKQRNKENNSYNTLQTPSQSAAAQSWLNHPNSAASCLL